MNTACPPQGDKAPLGGRKEHVRVQRRPVHGVLLLDKPLGISSNQALQKAKWLLRAEKAGHTGTLDPMATGVLPLCFGAATKFSQLHLDANKEYEAVLRLGVETSTGDSEGEVISTCSKKVSEAEVNAVAANFVGHIRQIPPMHSALKKDGRALYEYARAGIEVERQAREVEILSLNTQLIANELGEQSVRLNVKCSKGTYIRTLGEDIGKALGCPGHLSALRRLGSGNFQITACLSLDELQEMSEEERLAALLPVDALLSEHTSVILDDENAGRFLSGMRRRGSWKDCEHVCVYASAASGSGELNLLGTAKIKAGELIPVRLLSPPEVNESNKQRTLNS